MGPTAETTPELQVECRPDPERGDVPQRFGTPGGFTHEIESVIDGWPGEGHRYFRVRARDGSDFILRQDTATGSWRVHFFVVRAPKGSDA